jgi:hypothetical protein
MIKFSTLSKIVMTLTVLMVIGVGIIGVFHIREFGTGEKVVVKKLERIGTHYNLISDRQEVGAEYILVAYDGTYTEVSLGEYLRVNEGEQYCPVFGLWQE